MKMQYSSWVWEWKWGCGWTQLFCTLHVLAHASGTQPRHRCVQSLVRRVAFLQISKLFFAFSQMTTKCAGCCWLLADGCSFHSGCSNLAESRAHNLLNASLQRLLEWDVLVCPGRNKVSDGCMQPWSHGPMQKQMQMQMRGRGWATAH